MKELNEAKVLAVGPGGLDKEGRRVAPSVAPGDKVLIPQVGFTYHTHIWMTVGVGSGDWDWDEDERTGQGEREANDCVCCSMVEAP